MSLMVRMDLVQLLERHLLESTLLVLNLPVMARPVSRLPSRIHLFLSLQLSVVDVPLYGPSGANVHAALLLRQRPVPTARPQCTPLRPVRPYLGEAPRCVHDAHSQPRLRLHAFNSAAAHHLPITTWLMSYMRAASRVHFAHC